MIEALKAEAARRGVRQIGTPLRRTDLEPSHLYEIYMDEYETEFIFRRGILTIVTVDGKVY
ncbi:MAG: hypothetical protein K6C12_10385 [Oscillospiraceae bacterium]|nr:hypothetical protein [Oscillospiraceae bacterium]